MTNSRTPSRSPERVARSGAPRHSSAPSIRGSPVVPAAIPLLRCYHLGGAVNLSFYWGMCQLALPNPPPEWGIVARNNLLQHIWEVLPSRSRPQVRREVERILQQMRDSDTHDFRNAYAELAPRLFNDSPEPHEDSNAIDELRHTISSRLDPYSESLSHAIAQHLRGTNRMSFQLGIIVDGLIHPRSADVAAHRCIQGVLDHFQPPPRVIWGQPLSSRAPNLEEVESYLVSSSEAQRWLGDLAHSRAREFSGFPTALVEIDDLLVKLASSLSLEEPFQLRTAHLEACALSRISNLIAFWLECRCRLGASAIRQITARHVEATELWVDEESRVAGRGSGTFMRLPTLRSVLLLQMLLRNPDQLVTIDEGCRKLGSVASWRKAKEELSASIRRLGAEIRTEHGRGYQLIVT